MNDASKEIRYLNRDFDTTLRKLVDYAKYYYPNSFNDFSPATPAMIIMEMIAYVGDVLNFYIDKQTKESILYYATQKSSIYNIAQSYGYRIKTAIPSSVQLSFQCIVPIKSTVPGQADLTYAPILYPGTIVSSTMFPNSYFTVLNTINFNQNIQVQPTQKIGQQYKILKKKQFGYSVTEKIIDIYCDDIIRNNLKIYLPQKNVVKIESVIDSKGNNWYEVLNLANDTVTSDNIQYNTNTRVFSRKKTNKRFKKLVDLDDYTYLYFGSKEASNKLESDYYQAFYKYDYNQIATPAMLLLNNNYGQVPSGVTLTIKYLISTNVTVPSEVIDTINYKRDYNNQASPSLYSAVIESLWVNNQSPSIGGSGVQSLQSVKQNALATINTQNRLVTQQDYLNAFKIMPAEYGSIAKSYVKRNYVNNKIQLWILCYDNEKKLVNANQQIKNNLGEFLQRYRLLGDYISIFDAYIINVSCEFKIAVENSYSKKEVLYKVITVIKNYMNIDNYEIGSPINVSLLRNEILKVQGVSNVIKLDFLNKKGTGYSLVQYDMNSAKLNEKYFTSNTPSIFEIKNPDIDIVGSAI